MRPIEYVVALLMVAVTGAGCSSDDPAPVRDGTVVGVDGMAACATAVEGDALSCRGDLAAAGCPAEWEAVEKTTSCSVCRYHVGPVGEFLTRFVNCNPLGNGGGASCYYDAATGALAGAVVITDVTNFCCGKSAVQLSGAVTRELVMQTDALAVRACPAGS